MSATAQAMGRICRGNDGLGAVLCLGDDFQRYRRFIPAEHILKRAGREVIAGAVDHVVHARVQQLVAAGRHEEAKDVAQHHRPLIYSAKALPGQPSLQCWARQYLQPQAPALQGAAMLPRAGLGAVPVAAGGAAAL